MNYQTYLDRALQLDQRKRSNCLAIATALLLNDSEWMSRFKVCSTANNARGCILSWGQRHRTQFWLKYRDRMPKFTVGYHTETSCTRHSSQYREMIRRALCKLAGVEHTVQETDKWRDVPMPSDLLEHDVFKQENQAQLAFVPETTLGLPAGKQPPPKPCLLKMDFAPLELRAALAFADEASRLQRHMDLHLGRPYDYSDDPGSFQKAINHIIKTETRFATPQNNSATSQGETTMPTTQQALLNSTLKLETRTFLNGVDVSKMPDGQLYDSIVQAKAAIQTLEDIEPKPKSLVKQIDERKAQLDALVAWMDERDEKK